MLEHFLLLLNHLFPREWRDFKPRLSCELYGCTVYLKSLEERCWSIIVYKSSSWFTIAAYNSLDRQFILQNWVFESTSILWRSCQIIIFEINGIYNVVPESWVTTFIFKLMIRHKQVLWAACAWVHTNIFGPKVISSKRSLMTFSLKNIKL